jgi:hypothetical protein
MVDLTCIDEVYIQLLSAKRVINHAEMISNTTVNVTQVISIDKKKNHYVTEDEQQLASTYSDSVTSLPYINSQEQSDNNNHHGTIHELEIAHGLIDLLIKNKYTLPSLISTDPSELADILAIDQEVAKIICVAAKKKNNKRRKTHSLIH